MEKYIAAYYWLEHHGKAAAPYAGQWVAVFEKKILGAAPDLQHLMEQPAVKPHRKDALFTEIKN